MSYEAWGDNDDEYMTPEQAVEMGWLSPDECSQGMWDVFNERIRQRTPQPYGEGYSDERDDEYRRAELVYAATSYALAGVSDERAGRAMQCARDGLLFENWPWEADVFKPKGRRRNLVRAAALLLAEIDRLDRASKKDAGNE